MAKILVVDDNDGTLYLLVDILSEEGFDVVSANNGALALDLIYREQPDIILLDLAMPGLDGYEVLREIRGNPITNHLPVVLLTAVSAEQGEQIAIELGANHYVNKMSGPEMLKAVIRVALREAGNTGWVKPTPSTSFNVTQFNVNEKIPRTEDWKLSDERVD